MTKPEYDGQSKSQLLVCCQEAKLQYTYYSHTVLMCHQPPALDCMFGLGK